MYTLLPFTLLAVIPFASCRPSPDGIATGSNNNLALQTGYNVNIVKSNQNGECLATLTIFGKGVDKSVNYNCNKVPEFVINLDNVVIVGEEFYSDTQNELIQFTSGGCSKETFQTQDSKTTSTTAALSTDECQQVQTKIQIAKEMQAKFSMWYTTMQTQTKSQLEQLQDSVNSLSKLLTNGLFQQTVLPFNSLNSGAVMVPINDYKPFPMIKPNIINPVVPIVQTDPVVAPPDTGIATNVASNSVTTETAPNIVSNSGQPKSTDSGSF